MHYRIRMHQLFSVSMGLLVRVPTIRKWIIQNSNLVFYSQCYLKSKISDGRLSKRNAFEFEIWHLFYECFMHLTSYISICDFNCSVSNRVNSSRAQRDGGEQNKHCMARDVVTYHCRVLSNQTTNDTKLNGVNDKFNSAKDKNPFVSKCFKNLLSNTIFPQFLSCGFSQ